MEESLPCDAGRGSGDGEGLGAKAALERGLCHWTCTLVMLVDEGGKYARYGACVGWKSKNKVHTGETQEAFMIITIAPK